jgi:hypothetical protein
MCWSSHRYHRFEEPDYRRRRAAEGPESDLVNSPGDLRVSDAERNKVVEVLKKHTADGRLTLDEFEARVEETLSARTGSELRATLRELPAITTERRRRSRPTLNPLGRLAVLAIAVALVWLAVTHLAVWPLIIIAMLCLRVSGGRRRSAWVDHHTEGHRDADDMTYV